MKLTAAVAGAIVGFLAAAAQAFFHVFPPPVYGICIACHVRDMVNWIAAHISPLYGLTSTGALIIPGGGVSYHIPLLTVVGVLAGATFAAGIYKEFRWKIMRVQWQKPWAEFVWGMLVMISALLAGGCPTRTALKVAYMDITAMIVLAMIFMGAIVACQIIKIMSKGT